MKAQRKITWNPNSSSSVPTGQKDFSSLASRVEKKKASTLSFRRASTASIIGTGVLSIVVVFIYNMQEEETIPTPNPKEKTINTLAIGDTLGAVALVSLPIAIEPTAPINETAVAQPKTTEPETTARVTQKEIKKDSNKAQKFQPTKFKEAYPSVGMDSLISYFDKEIHKILVEKSKLIDQKVLVRFKIDSTQRPILIKVESLNDTVIENKLRNLVWNMPDWMPATANDKPIATWFSLPLNLTYDSINISE